MPLCRGGRGEAATATGRAMVVARPITEGDAGGYRWRSLARKEAVCPFDGRPLLDAAEGPLSRPLDKGLGREADPEGGNLYEKGSAWARSVYPQAGRKADHRVRPAC